MLKEWRYEVLLPQLPTVWGGVALLSRDCPHFLTVREAGNKTGRSLTVARLRDSDTEQLHPLCSQHRKPLVFMQDSLF